MSSSAERRRAAKSAGGAKYAPFFVSSTPVSVRLGVVTTREARETSRSPPCRTPRNRQKPPRTAGNRQESRPTADDLEPRRSGAGVFEHLPGDPDGCRRRGPARIEGEVGDQFDEFVATDAVLERELQMGRQFVRPIESDERRHGYQAAVARRQLRALPDIAEQH